MTDVQALEVTELCRKLRVPDGPRSRAFGLISDALAARERAVWLEAAQAVENGHFLSTESLEYKWGQQVAVMLRRQAEEVGK